jgi:2-polyprenyl-3-methyl-5-hydroxy-6-metoxy-1,4-benzoquinol methylase
MHCKLCGGPSEFLCSTIREKGKQRQLDHFRCLQCELVFVGNEFTEDELAEAYNGLDPAAYYRDIALETNNKMKRSQKDLAEWGIAKDSTILDIGTGNGSFLALLHADGYRNLSGHEIPGSHPTAIEGLPIRMYRDFDYLELPSACFDCITLLDVAEHVVNPEYLFLQCQRALKPGGLLYFHTPMVTNLDRAMHFFQRAPVLKKIGVAWQHGRTSIFHLQNYSRRSIDYVLQKCGFADYQCVQTNELSWPVAKYVQIYLTNRLMLPTWTSRCLAPFFVPLLASNMANPNKGIVSARKIRVDNRSMNVSKLAAA